jgi:hypothetical protein
LLYRQQVAERLLASASRSHGTLARPDDAGGAAAEANAQPEPEGGPTGYALGDSSHGRRVIQTPLCLFY